MKGTKLWQDTGSPLIAGRSRRQKSPWREWSLATLCALGVSVAACYALGWVPLEVESAAALAWLVPGAAAGAWLGVWLARNMGWRRIWLVGAAFGTPLAVAGFLLFA